MKSITIKENVNVVQTGVPSLIGLYFLVKCQMIFNNVDNTLHCLSYICDVPLVRKRGLSGRVD